MNRNFLVTFAISTGLVAAVACGGTDTTTTGDGSCGSYFDSITAYAQRCGGSAPTGTRSDFVALCNAAIAAPGSNLTTGIISSCASAVSGQAQCTSGISGVAACKPPPGKLADGSACGDSLQCASGSCKTTSSNGNGPSCGTCAKVAKEGEACNVAPDNLSCGPDLKCTKNLCVKDAVIPNGGACSFTGPQGYNCTPGTFCNAPLTPNATGTCAPLPKKGETCTVACDVGLACSGGKCIDKLDVGAPCTGSECKTGLYCDTTGTKTCTAKKVAKAGESCGSSQVTCDAGLSCETTGVDQQTCIALKKNGEACAPTDKCADFLVCSGGKCVVDDPALCK